MSRLSGSFEWLRFAACAVAGLAVGAFVGWQLRGWRWQWGNAAEWITAAIGAAAVVAAAVYATRERRERLRERLEDVYFGGLKPNVIAFATLWTTARDACERDYHASKAGAKPVSGSLTDADYSRLWAARDAVLRDLYRVDVKLSQLGRSKDSLLELHHQVHVRAYWMLPSAIDGLEVEPDNAPQGDMSDVLVPVEQEVLVAIGAQSKVDPSAWALPYDGWC
jgi:hypothetical protein